jgi:hypothetical protein
VFGVSATDTWEGVEGVAVATSREVAVMAAEESDAPSFGEAIPGIEGGAGVSADSLFSIFAARCGS